MSRQSDVGRTEYCGRVGAEWVGATVTVAGWVHRRRDHGGLVFIDLRDRTGLVQVVVSPDAAAAFETAEAVRVEWVVSATGEVVSRPEGMANPDLATGAVEVRATSLTVWSRSDTPPVSPQDGAQVDERLRLKHRYLDLRRPELLRNFVLRDRVVFAVRRWMHAHEFLDIETPTLGRSTPEGARDFLVPSRLQPGHVYALPQSPQVWKQLLMVGGVDRYYQIVKVFRDEALRSDRQPEFTQIDVETSFLSQGQILDLMEDMVRTVFQEALGVTLPEWPRLTHAEALAQYGSDKPDLRAGPPLVDLTAAAREVATLALPAETRWIGLVAEGAALSRKQLDTVVDRARELGAPGLIWIRRTPDGFRTNAGRALAEGGAARLASAAGMGPDGLLAVMAGPAPAVHRHAGTLRLELAAQLGRVAPGFHFLWVTDFPLFEWSEDEGRWTSAHHPFTMPHREDRALLATDPGRARS